MNHKYVVDYNRKCRRQRARIKKLSTNKDILSTNKIQVDKYRDLVDSFLEDYLKPLLLPVQNQFHFTT